MKNNRILLAEWLPTEGENIEIDWPKVQRTIGVDHLEWLLKQHKEQCQLFIDKNQSKIKLVAEFYNDQLLTAYHLMWAK